MKTWSNRRRVVFLAAICVVAAIATVIAVAAIDDYARGEVRKQAEEVYFKELRKAVAEEVEEGFRQNGCDEQAVEGLAAADRFLAEERRHIRLQIREPNWGWQVDRYRFTIRWRSTWIAEFSVDDETYKPINRIVNEEFKDVLENKVCRLECLIDCALNGLFGSLRTDGTTAT